jgi:uracil-DNA glycosylase family 4
MPVRLELVAEDAGGCTRCRLADGRTQVVFGMGAPDADLMFIGEGPGAEEDRQGLPFVGRSGQLLDRLLAEELGIHRDRVYIANVVKCRPPGNRDPLPDEIAACRPWLETQLDLIAPKVIVTLGRFATQALLGTKEGITSLRGRVHPFRDGIVVVPTFHPAAALRGGAEPLAKMRADLIRAKLALEHAGVADAPAAAPEKVAATGVDNGTAADAAPHPPPPSPSTLFEGAGR